MKSILLALFFSFSGALFAECPNFSGTYVEHYGSLNDRLSNEWTWKQNGCEKIEFESRVFLKNGTMRKDGPWEWITDGKMRGGNTQVQHSYAWDGQRIVGRKLDVNREHCDTREIFEKDAKNNLRYSWRFECPDGKDRPWYTPETTQGWVGHTYEKK